MDDGFFTQVRYALEGFVASVDGEMHATSHGRGVKVWFGEATREHYEAQLIRLDGAIRLEIGFHTEYPKGPQNDQVLQHLLASETRWRANLGDEAEAGAFLGRGGWLRISECWDPPTEGSDARVSGADIDSVIDVAARLADYINALEPIRRSRATNA
jgi:hypothetical protein